MAPIDPSTGLAKEVDDGKSVGAGEHEVGDDEYLVPRDSCCDRCTLSVKRASHVDARSILFEKVSPMDIRQGDLGDCWLLSSFASIAEYPDFVRQLVVEAGDGHYLVHLHSFEAGEVKTYAINDALPYKGMMKYKLVNVHESKQSEIWTCVLEKAFAKMAGGYGNLEGGFSVWAFAALTGCMNLELLEIEEETGLWNMYPVTLPQSDNPLDMEETQWWGESQAKLNDQQLIQTLASYDRNHYLMCVASNAAAGLSDKEATAKNVHYGHAYTVLQIADRPCGTDFHLLKLRNPWGSSEFTGAWSDGDSKWDEYPNVAAELKYAEKEDGVFWIGLSDFDAAYHQIFICKKNMQGKPHTDVPHQMLGGATTRGIAITGQPKELKKTCWWC